MNYCGTCTHDAIYLKQFVNDKMSLQDKFANDYRHKNETNELCSSKFYYQGQHEGLQDDRYQVLQRSTTNVTESVWWWRANILLANDNLASQSYFTAIFSLPGYTGPHYAQSSYNDDDSSILYLGWS